MTSLSVCANEPRELDRSLRVRQHLPDGLGRFVSTRMPIATHVFAAILSGCALLALAWAHLDAFGLLVLQWRTNPEISHGPLVVLVSLWMILRAYRVDPQFFRTVDARTSLAGLFEIALGLALHVVGWFSASLLVQFVSFAVVARGMLLVLGGWSAHRAYGFAALFLLFAVPLPEGWYQYIALVLQNWATSLSAWVLSLLGVAVHRQGYLLQLAGQSLEVGQACNGLRQLMAFVALSTAAGALGGFRAPGRAVLIMASLPIALCANVVRIVVIALLASAFGLSVLEEPWHTLEGLIGIMIGVVLTIALSWLIWHGEWLARQFASRTSLLQGDSSDSNSADPAELPQHSFTGVSLMARTVALAVIVVAGVGTDRLLQRHVKAAGTGISPAPLVGLSNLPDILGQWRGQEKVPGSELLYGQDHLLKEYTNVKSGRTAQVWMVFTPDRSDRRHHPELCMAVAGRKEDPGARRLVELSSQGMPAQAYRFLATDGATRMIYWHYSLFPRLEPSLDSVQRLYRVCQTPPASVTVEIAAADRPGLEFDELQDLARLVDEAARGLVGPMAYRSSDRLPIAVIPR